MRAISLFAALLVSGCALTTQPNTDPTDTKNVVVKDGADYFAALAESVKGRTILDSEQLARAVTIGKRNGWLTAEQVTAFDNAFPKATAGEALSEEDAAKLRSLK